jgi:hypothetical protein
MAGTVRAGSAGPGAEQNSGSEGGERELGVLVLFFLTGEDPWSLTSFPGLLVCVLDARNGTHTDTARSRGKADIVMALPQRARGVKIWEWGGSIRAHEVVDACPCPAGRALPPWQNERPAAGAGRLPRQQASPRAQAIWYGDALHVFTHYYLLAVRVPVGTVRAGSADL